MVLATVLAVVLAVALALFVAHAPSDCGNEGDNMVLELALVLITVS